MTQVSYAPGRAGRCLVALAASVLAVLLFQAGTAQATVTGTDDASAVANAIGDGSPGLVTAAAFTVNGPLAECSNGQDDDGNGQVDFPNDAGCKSATDDSEENDLEFDSSVPECQNKADDDGDGKIDFGGGASNDPQCGAAADVDESTAGIQQPECATATDEDGDGFGGFATGDPECSSTADNDESFKEECSDGIDNDDEDRKST